MHLNETTEDSEKLGGTTPAAKLSKWLCTLHNRKNISLTTYTVRCALRLKETEAINFTSRKKYRHEDYGQDKS